MTIMLVGQPYLQNPVNADPQSSMSSPPHRPSSQRDMRHTPLMAAGNDVHRLCLLVAVIGLRQIDERMEEYLVIVTMARSVVTFSYVSVKFQNYI